MKRQTPIGTATLALLLTACAERPGSTESANIEPDAPTTVEIVCEADGTTTLLTPEVEVRPDGIGLRVRSSLDEPASLNGLGMDVNPGVTEDVLPVAPGEIGVACWPFSEHGSDEPPRQDVVVRDPKGLFVSAELACGPGSMSWNTIFEFQDTGEGLYAGPIEAAEAFIDERPDDAFMLAGYPEQEERPAILVRSGSTVASVAVSRADDGRWYVAAGSGCDDVRTAF